MVIYTDYPSYIIKFSFEEMSNWNNEIVFNENDVNLIKKEYAVLSFISEDINKDGIFVLK